jgi:hypothetical protein
MCADRDPRPTDDTEAALAAAIARLERKLEAALPTSPR